ncbi:hypothetical protein P3T76_016455 [Phytophthora citrophthora]|uniref:Uncharacterized protein n=1 Tax=Phytophthora citrophthora TaxID=4793 RepID=A0AAD9FXK4_9STRA|nr:hypothetical protein P3T76_016455 [Phytophthora citrophthora]
MVERVWSLVEDAGETCLVARSGDEGFSALLLLFCCSSAPTYSSALLLFAAFFPAVRAPQPTSLMLPTHSWRIGTSAAVESDSPTRTKIDTCTAPYSSLVEDAGERCLVARSGDEDWSRMREKGVWWRGVATRWLVYPPVTRVTRVQFPDGKLLFAPTCSSALLLFCSSALLPPPTLLLFCSSALLFFAAFFPAVRAPQPTSLMLPTHSWRIGTSAAVESDSPTRTKIDTCTAPYSSLVEDAGETCLVARSGDEGMVERVWSLVEDAGERCLVARSGDEGMVERGVVVCVGGGRSIGRGCGRKVFGGAEWRRGYGRARVVVCVGGGRSIGRGCGRCLVARKEGSLVARSGDEAVLCVSWTHGGTVDVTRMQRLVRYGLLRCLVARSGDEGMARLVEDAGERCLVARSGDEGMVERVWSLVEDAGETCLVARSGDEGMVERVWSILVSIVVSIPACHAGDPGFNSRTGSFFLLPPALLLFCSHLLFCSSAPTYSSALLLFCSSALLLFCFAFLCRFLSCRSRTTTDISHATNAQLAHRHLCCCRIGLTNADEDRHVHGAVLVIGRGCGRKVFGGAEWRRGLTNWRIGTSAAVESDSPTRTKIDTCTAPYSSLVEDAGETCLVARSGDEGMVERVWSLVEDAGETCLVARSGDEGMVERVWSLVEDAGETCLVARSGDEGMVERVWSLVEDAGETCLVARSGDEGMVERVWSLVEDAGETCLVARSGDEGMVERVWSCV